ncbi:lytic transglycosylase domain-containing protein [Megalodesulfovibrio paquesii]
MHHSPCQGKEKLRVGPAFVRSRHRCAPSLAFRIACIACLALLSACAGTQPQPPAMSPLSVEYLDNLDAVITESGPINVDGVELSDQEKTALNTPLSLRWELNDFAREAIKREFVHLHYKNKANVSVWLQRSERYIGYAKRVFRAQGLPEDLAYLPYIESGYNPIACSPAGAMGVWQFMPETGKRHGLACTTYIDERRNPWKATFAAANYLKKLHEQFKDWSLALAAYNAGEGKIGRACAATGATNFFQLALRNDSLPPDMQLKPETLQYVPRFIAMLKIANNLQALGYQPVVEQVGAEPQRHTIPPNLDLKALADNVGMDWETFRSHNPHYRIPISPPGQECHIYLPQGLEGRLQAYLQRPVMATSKAKAAALAEAQGSSGIGKSQGKSSWHVVEKGDTFPKIAAKYNVPLDQLMKINKQRSKDLKKGELIALPSSRDAREPAAPAKQLAQSQPPSGPSGQSGPTAKSPASAPATSYVVQTGDTLFSLTKKFNVPMDALLKANGLSEPGALRAGMTLNLPGNAPAAEKQVAQSKPADNAPAKPAKAAADAKPNGKKTIYKVAQGDTIWSIARKFQVSPFDLLTWNNMNKDSALKPGDKLAVYVASN